MMENIDIECQSMNAFDEAEDLRNIADLALSNHDRREFHEPKRLYKIALEMTMISYNKF